MDAPVGVTLDGPGRRLGELAVPNTEAGYAELVRWVLGFDDLAAARVEGTGNYGAVRGRSLALFEGEGPARGGAQALHRSRDLPHHPR